MADPSSPYISRAGLKLAHALRDFGVDPAGWAAADFGCNVGGFADCLLRHGAAKVCALDTGYGVLDWKLRNDPRIVVMERTNALHADPPAGGGVDLVVIDLGWTPQRLAIPAAVRWLRPGGRIISLVKPHYELSEEEKRAMLRGGALDEQDAERVLHRVIESAPGLGVEVLAWTTSPIRGGKSSRKGRGAGNVEYLILARPAEAGESARTADPGAA